MNNIADITFIYDTLADICLLREDKSIRELTIKGSCKYQGKTNGTWFQIDKLVSHWISFRKDKFKTNTWQVFYKCIGEEQITYYRKVFSVENTNPLLIFSFMEKNEWIKDLISGKWKNKY